MLLGRYVFTGIPVLILVLINDGTTSQICRSDDHCIASNGAICNNKGSCNCGRCECHSGYQGQTCEDCKDCVGACVRYRDCVSCIVFGNGPLSPIQCQSQCSTIKPKIHVLPILTEDHGNTCLFRVDGCTLEFAYKHDNDGLSINVLDNKIECSGSDNKWT